MSKSNQVAENLPEKANRPKASVGPVVAYEPGVEVESLAGAPTGLAAAAGDGTLAGQDSTLAGQAARLGDRQVQPAQRQALAAHIGQVHGNAHLQRVVASIQRKAAREPYQLNDNAESDDSLEGANTGGPPAATAAEPPPHNGGKANGTGNHPALQRQEGGDEDRPSEAEKAAALAAARAAVQEANQAVNEGRNQVAKSKAEKNAEQQTGEVAKQKASQAAAEAKSTPGAKGGAVGAKAEANGKAPSREKGAAAGKNGKGPAPDQAAGADLGPGEAPGEYEKAPASPEEDPAFQAVTKKVQGVSQKEKSHPAAEKKSAEAQEAAEAPGAEIEARAQSNQVGEMEAAETPGFNAAAFKAQLMQRIQELAPKSAEQADNLKKEDKLSGVKDQAAAKAGEEKEKSKAPMQAAAAQEPDTGQVEPKAITPLPEAQPGEAPPDLGAEAAAPKVKQVGEVEAPLQAEGKKIDQQMAEADVSDEQLAKSNEPEFTGALDAKKEAKEHAETAPQEFRQAEQGTLEQASGEAAALAQEKTQGMHGDRAGLLNQVGDQQGQAKSKDEQVRQRIAGDIHKIYEKTRTNVEKILDDLDGKVEQAIDEGAAAAKVVFENYVESRMEAYKQERYGGWFGWARWLKDKVKGMPAEVNVFYREGRDLFIREMDAVIDKVVSIIAAGLAEAKAEIASGKKEIQIYLESLPAEEQKLGQEAAAGIQSKFDELEASVDSKQEQLIDSLAQKYQENLQAVDARIEEMKAANAGLIDKAINAVVGVIKIILKLKDMLLTILAKVADVVGKIIKDPIGFLGNLVAGIKQGFQNFLGNILEHLKTGLIAWLTGAFGSAGLQLPDDIFSLQGIFSLVMQLLGISWSYIRAKAVKLLGEPAVKALETGFEVFQILINEGPAGLWRFVQDKFSDLKETVMGQIQELIQSQVIQAGIKWIMGLLSPVGAFIKAAMAIYEIVTFFVQKAGQIGELINAIVDGVAAIAGGAVSGAAKLIENALGKALPLVIGFLASLLGISGLAKKVQAIIQKIRARIDQAIDAILMKAKQFAKKLIRKMGFGREEEKEALTSEESEKVKAQALEEAKNLSKRNYSNLGEYSKMLEQVYKKYSPQGLKSLEAIGKEKQGQISISAEASPAENTTVAWDEVGVVKLSPDQYEAALGMVHPAEYLSDIDRFIDEVGQRAAIIAVKNSYFVDLCKKKSWAVAGTIFHNIAKDVVNEVLAQEQEKIPEGYKPEAEFTVKKGKGGSRIDLFIENPNGELIEIDWKTTGKSGMSYDVRKKEMPKHAKHMKEEVGKKLIRQESRSWVPYVRAHLAGEDIEWPGF